MKNKAAILLTALMLSLTMPLLTAKAMTLSPDVYVFAWVDKPQYMPGETGTLYITVLNMKESPVEIKNITITYPWWAYIKDHWEGNETVKKIDVAVGSKGGAWNTEKSFKIPEDGRTPSGSTSIYIVAVFQEGTPPIVYSKTSSPSVNVINPTSHETVKDVDKILTMITVTAVLMIISAIIVAAAVIVAGRGRKAIPTA